MDEVLVELGYESGNVLGSFQSTPLGTSAEGASFEVAGLAGTGWDKNFEFSFGEELNQITQISQLPVQPIPIAGNRLNKVPVGRESRYR